MVILGLQGWLGFLGGCLHRRSPNYQTKKNSGIALIVIIVAHGLFIFIALTAKTKQRENIPVQPLLQLIQLQPEDKDSVVRAFARPDINFQSTISHLQLPVIDITDYPLVHADLSVDQISSPYELPNPNDKLYGDVFDPVLRKKLQEAHANRKPKKHEVLNTWETSGGRTMVDVGDGECIASIPKTDSRERGTSWSMLRVRCGKTDSEKMMDNVTADLEARKHPLKTQ